MAEKPKTQEEQTPQQAEAQRSQEARQEGEQRAQAGQQAEAGQQEVQTLEPNHPGDTTVTVLEQPDAAVTPESVAEAQLERAGRDVPDDPPPAP